MEQSYGNDYTASFDWFMRDYLSVKTGTIPRIDRVYDSFKTYASSSKAPDTITEVVQDFYKFSGYYVNMVLHKEPDTELQKGFKGCTSHLDSIQIPIIDNQQDMSVLCAQLDARQADIQQHCFIIAGHGTYAWGETLFDAQKHLETLDYLCECEFLL